MILTFRMRKFDMVQRKSETLLDIDITHAGIHAALHMCSTSVLRFTGEEDMRWVRESF